jgi:hypothetical protein
MEGIKKIIKDENGVEFEITEYPDVPVIVVEEEDDSGE